MLRNLLTIKGVERIEKKQQLQIRGGLQCKLNGSCANYGRDCDEYECAKPPLRVY